MPGLVGPFTRPDRTIKLAFLKRFSAADQVEAADSLVRAVVDSQP